MSESGSMGGRGGGIWPVLAVLLLLLAPIEPAGGGRLAHALGDSAHVVLFGTLAWLWGRHAPIHRRGWRLWLVVTCAAGVIEGLQHVAGRTPEWADWFFGAVGAGVVCSSWGVRRIATRFGGVALAALLPLLWAGALVGMERASFPVLVEPQRWWGAFDWVENGGVVRRLQGEFRFTPEAAEDRAPYPGCFREPVVRDWRKAKGMELSVFWPEDGCAVMAVRVDDGRESPGYSERFQREFAVTQGWNEVWIPVEELLRTAGGEALDAGGIRRWGVFLVSDSRFSYFSISRVCLPLGEE